MYEFVINLKWWVSGKHPTNLINLITAWVEQVKAWLEFVATNDDPQTCEPEVLELLAWERRVNRLPNEPTWLFRNRVEYAFLNARDAGSTAGFVRIFERLGLGFVKLDERPVDQGRDWDVIILEMTGGELADNSALLSEVVNLYGRTCRRYEFTVTTVTPIVLGAGEFSSNHETYLAKFEL